MGTSKGEGSKVDRGRMTALELWSGPEIPKEEWMLRSLVREMKNLELIPSLREAFMVEGHITIQVRYLRDDRVLLTNHQESNLVEVLQGSKGWRSEFVDNLKPWSSSFAPINRVTWVRCTGIPLHMWTMDCFKHLLLQVGDVIKIDEDTSEFVVLEFSRLLVRTTTLNFITLARKILIKGTTYTISIIEEGEALLHPNCCCREESSVEDDVFSGWSLNGVTVTPELSESGGEDDDGLWPVETKSQHDLQGSPNHSLGDNKNPRSNTGAVNRLLSSRLNS